ERAGVVVGEHPLVLVHHLQRARVRDRHVAVEIGAGVCGSRGGRHVPSIPSRRLGAPLRRNPRGGGAGALWWAHPDDVMCTTRSLECRSTSSAARAPTSTSAPCPS